MAIKWKSKYKSILKATAIIVAFLFLLNDISYALAPAPGTLQPIVRCEYQILSWIHSGRLKFAETDEDILFLNEINHADAMLLSHGKVLASSHLKKDPQKLMRMIIHEEIEAVLQVMAREDRAKYSALINTILSWDNVREKYYALFAGANKPDLPDELLANDIVSTAFELLIPKTNRLIDDRQIAPSESDFLKTIEPIINANKHNYFTGVFWDDSVRQQKIRIATSNGMSFAQARAIEKYEEILGEVTMGENGRISIPASLTREISAPFFIACIAKGSISIYSDNEFMGKMTPFLGKSFTDVKNSALLRIIGSNFVRIPSLDSARRFIIPAKILDRSGFSGRKLLFVRRGGKIEIREGRSAPSDIIGVGDKLDGVAPNGPSPAIPAIPRIRKDDVTPEVKPAKVQGDSSADPANQSSLITNTLKDVTQPSGVSPSDTSPETEKAYQIKQSNIKVKGTKVVKIPDFSAISLGSIVRNVPSIEDFAAAGKCMRVGESKSYMLGSIMLTKKNDHDDLRIIKYEKVMSPTGEPEGTIVIYYSYNENAITVMLRGADIYEPIMPGSDVMRGDEDWDKAIVKIYLDGNRDRISMLDHMVGSGKGALAQMGLSRTQIAIMLNDARLSAGEFINLYAALNSFLVFNEIDEETRARERLDSKMVPLSVVNRVNIALNKGERVIPEDLDILVSFEHYKSWAVREIALNALRKSKDMGVISGERMAMIETVFETNQIKEDLIFIERLLIQDPALLQEILFGVTGQNILKSAVDRVEINWFNKGSNKNIYHALKIILKDGREYSVAASSIRDNPTGGGYSARMIDAALDGWKMLSSKGSHAVPEIIAHRWVFDFRPRIADIAFKHVYVDALGTGRDRWLHNDINIVFRRFVEGKDLEEFLFDEKVTPQEKIKAIKASLQAYLDIWNHSKSADTNGLFNFDCKPANVVVSKEGDIFTAKSIDLDGLREIESLDEIRSIISRYPDYRGFEVVLEDGKALAKEAASVTALTDRIDATGVTVDKVSFGKLIRAHFVGKDVIRGLDLGAGTGTKTKWVEKMLKENFKDAVFKGIDSNEQFAQIASKRGNTVELGAVESLPYNYATASQDLITMFYPYPDSIRDFIATAKKLVKTDGLIVIVLQPDDLKAVHDGDIKTRDLRDALIDFRQVRVKRETAAADIPVFDGDSRIFVYSPRDTSAEVWEIPHVDPVPGDSFVRIQAFDKVDKFIDDRKVVFGDRCQGIRYTLVELILNIAYYTKGGIITIREELNSDGSGRKLSINAVDAGPGLPMTPNELLAQSIESRKSDSSGQGHAGFWRISLNPDRVSIKSGNRLFTRVTKDEHASRWFDEKTEQDSVSGTEFILEYDISAAQLIKRAYKYPRSGEGNGPSIADDMVMSVAQLKKPSVVESVAADSRPVEAGLLHEAYVLNDMHIKNVVNRQNRPLRVLYAGAGADISNVLLSTNATEMYFVSDYQGLSQQDLRKLESDEYLFGGYSQDLSPDYALKFRDGHAVGVSLITRKDILGALAFELHAIGASEIHIDMNNYRPRISFTWAYQKDALRKRSITIIDGNATVPENYSDVLYDGIDIYYQRAGQEIAYEYRSDKSFLLAIHKYLNMGGYFVTDDHAFDQYNIQAERKNKFIDVGSSFPIQMQEVAVPDNDDLESVITDLSHSVDGKGKASVRYGWYMRIRQKVISAPPSLRTDKEDIVIAGNASESMQLDTKLNNKRIEITASVADLPEKLALTESLKGLEDVTWQEFGAQASDAGIAISATERHAQSLILYADDILENAMVVDLEHTLRKILAKQNILTGGKIIIYSKDGRNAAILEKLIKHADPNVMMIIITQKDMQANGSEVKEAGALLRIARAKGAKEILGLIRGPTTQPEDLAVFAKDSGLPIVIVGPEKGIYSFAQAISMAMDAKLHGGATNGWLMMLPPIRAITEDIKLQYEQYRHSLLALIAA